MANVIIVTKHLYLLCEVIHSIHIDVCSVDNSLLRLEDPRRTIKKKGQKPKKNKGQLSLDEFQTKVDALNTYIININYKPVIVSQNNMSSSNEWQQCQINVQGKKEAESVFKAIVYQIREQMPDQLFLNELVDKLLEGQQ